MERPSWDMIFLEICRVISARSTCCKYKTACIIVRDRNVISIGYNGTPSGAIHCDEYWMQICSDTELGFEDFLATDFFRENHREWSRIWELHAEVNAIVKNAGDLKNCTLYTLLSPCIQCSKIIVSAGIKKVVYLEKYKRDFEDTAKFLDSNNITFVAAAGCAQL